MPIAQGSRSAQRDRLLEVARAQLEASEDGRLRARSVTAAVGASTQAIYTYFGGVPALLDALVDQGFTEVADAASAVPQTRDPVADFIAGGAAYAGWALANPRLYRLMLGLGGEVMGMRIDRGGSVHGRPAEVDSFEVLVAAVRRMVDAGRIGAHEPPLVAAEFLAATHGYVLLAMGGGVGAEAGVDLARRIGLHLLVGLGDRRSRAEASIARVLGS